MRSFPDIWQRFGSRFRYFRSLPATRKTPFRCAFRAVWWRICCLLGVRLNVRVKSWNTVVSLPPVWAGAGTTQFFISRELYEPELAFLNRLLAPGQTFVDAGANIGLYTLAAASIVGAGGKVLAFEPEANALRALKNNVALNHLRQVEVLDSALSNSDGQAGLFGGDERSVSASLGTDDNSKAPCQIVRTVRLDSVLAERNHPVVHVLKMDVEGAEAMILQGALQTLGRCKPTVIFEVNEAAAQALGLPPDAAWDLLASLKYRFFELSKNGELVSAQKPKTIRNIVAVP
jgi:FkbM family methyltransferase